MYEIKRTGKRITDEVRITEGERQLVLPVSLSVDSITRQLPACQRALLAARERVSEMRQTDDAEASQNAHEALVGAVQALLHLIFGDEGAKNIQSFYGGDMLDALSDLAPYVAQVIIPQVTEAQQALADTYRQAGAK